IHRRRRGALPPALRATRVARRDGAGSGVGDGRPLRAADGPLAPAGLVAARRELTFLLAEPERRLLRGIATRLPRWVTSDGLTALGVFRLGYSRIGPTEARIVLVAANVALALSGPGAGVVPVATGAAAALAVGMFVMVAVRIGRNLSALGRLEPPPTASPPHDLTTTSPEGYLLKHEAVRPI